MCEPTLYFGTAEAGATALNATGLVVSASASATATSTISQMDADEKAYQIALKDAQSQAENSSNIMTQGTEVTFATIEQGGATGLNLLNENTLSTFSNFGISLPDFGKTWKKTEILSDSTEFKFWTCIAMTSTGGLQTAFDTYSNGYISEDYGKTWTLVVPKLGGDNRGGTNSVAVSSSGKFQTAVQPTQEMGGSGIFISSDYGNNWVQASIPELGKNLFWNAVSMSSSGQYQSAVGSTSKVKFEPFLYTSSDYGITWTRNDEPDIQSINFQFIALNASGEIQIANDDSSIWKSSDYGKTWVKIFDLPKTTEFSDLISLAISSDGDVQTAITYYEGIWVSKDFGVSWKQNIPLGTEYENWTAVTISSSGKNQAIVNNTSNVVDIWTSSDYGSTWVKRNTFLTDAQFINLHSILASSSSGEYISVSIKGILTSPDYGITWEIGTLSKSEPVDTQIFIILTSSSGQYQTGLGRNALWLSSNFGLTWEFKELQNFEGFFGFNAAISSTGQYQTITDGFSNVLWKSKDYGNTWIREVVEIAALTAFEVISISSSGKYQTTYNVYSDDYGTTWALKSDIFPKERTARAGPFINSSGQYQSISYFSSVRIGGTSDIGKYGIYLSDNYGLTWVDIVIGTFIITPTTSPLVLSNVSISATGQYQTVSLYNSNTYSSSIYVSNDFGKTWKKQFEYEKEDIFQVSMSATGQYQTAVSGSIIFSSIDFGHTWIKNSIPEELNIFNIAMSSSGQYNTVTGNSGIFTSNNPLTPPGINYGDYLYWDSNVNSWSVGSTSVSLGYQSGQTGQSEYSVAIGFQAGQTGQSIQSVAIGYKAGQMSQGATFLDDSSPGQAIAIGFQAGQIEQSTAAIAIGYRAGQTNQKDSAVAIGDGAGFTGQKESSVAIGVAAGQMNQSNNAVAIGSNAGFEGQKENAVAIGSGAGQTNQSKDAVAIGSNAGFEGQKENAVAIGFGAGLTNQSKNAVAIGENAGLTEQGEKGIAIGFQAGQTNQSNHAIAIGKNAGFTGQGEYGIAIGFVAGQTNQSNDAIAIGDNAGFTGQKINSVAIGVAAGQTNQGEKSVAIGVGAGRYNQGLRCVAIASAAGSTGQGDYAVAMGFQAGNYYQGTYSIAIGAHAGQTGQAESSIVLNASKNAINGDTSGFYVAPIRETSDSEYMLQYNSFTKEVTYNSLSQNNSGLTVASEAPTVDTPGSTGQICWHNNVMYAYVGKWVKLANTMDV